MTSRDDTLRIADALWDVAAAIWDADDLAQPKWAVAYDQVSAGKAPELRQMVQLTIVQARAAVNALRLSDTGTSGNQDALGMAMAGEHVSGSSVRAVAETFDAVLDHVLRY